MSVGSRSRKVDAPLTVSSDQSEVERRVSVLPRVGANLRTRRPTVKDVAAAAGVSPSTVSNVLHDHPYVTPQKRARVEAAIKRLGYRPSFAGRQLRGNSGVVLALAVPDIRSPYFGELAHTIITEARSRGMALFIDETDGALDQERLIAHGYPSRGIDGVIFCPVSIAPEELEELKSDIPTVLLGEYVPGGSFDHVAIDSFGSANEVTEHLLESGRRRFGFVGFCGPREGVGPARFRLDGLRSALAGRALGLDEAAIFDHSPHTREEGWRVGHRLIDQGVQIDALLCAADVLAIGALAAFRERGVVVPDDVAVAAWDDAPESRFAAPPLTSVAHDIDSIACRAINAIEQRLREPDRPVEHLIVPHHLVRRASS